MPCLGKIFSFGLSKRFLEENGARGNFRDAPARIDRRDSLRHHAGAEAAGEGFASVEEGVVLAHDLDAALGVVAYLGTLQLVEGLTEALLDDAELVVVDEMGNAILQFLLLTLLNAAGYLCLTLLLVGGADAEGDIGLILTGVDAAEVVAVAAVLHGEVANLGIGMAHEEALGIEVGDAVCFDPRALITESGYIKSRFLDDKLSVGILLGPFLGAFLGELIAMKPIGAALKGGFGAFLGFLSGMFLKILACIAMTFIYVMLVFWH